MKSELKKILIITYYWPPAGGPGVQRWLKFSKYLPEFGWEPIIYTPENPSYPLVDPTLTKEVPESIKIIKTKIWEPYQWAEKLNKNNKKFKAGQFDIGKNQSWQSKLSIWVRGNFFIPDARVFWVQPSIKFLKKYLLENQIETVVTTGPPHSMHLIGLGLQKEIPHLKWIADFRDPWTEISYYQHLKLTAYSDKKHKRLEQLVFKNANLTLATSFSDAENFKNKGAHSVRITNGFDTESSTPSEKEKKNSKFCVAYIGVLEQLRNPEILWKCLNEVYTENENFRKDFELKFVGRIDDKIVDHLLNTSFKDAIKNLGYVSHQDSVSEMNSADVLLITNFPKNESKGIIPGKLFEYLATGNYIWSFGPEEADVEKILSDTKAGKHFKFDEKEALKIEILKTYDLWKSHQLKNTSLNIGKYSRKNLTKVLAEQLNLLY